MVPPKTTSGVSRAAPQFLSQDRDLHLGVVTPPQRSMGISVWFLGCLSLSLDSHRHVWYPR